MAIRIKGFMDRLKADKKLRIITLAGVALLLAAIIILIVSLSAGSGDGEKAYKETTVQRGSVVAGVTENGSLSVGETEQTFELELGTSSTTASSSTGATQTVNAGGAMGGGMGGASMGGMVSTTTTTGSAALDVEEVYVAVGQYVSKGDKLLKLSADSIEDARSELEKTVKSAELKLSEAEINRQLAKVQAEYDYKANKSLGSTAKSTYNATISSLTLAVTQAQEAVDGYKEQISEKEAELAELKKQGGSAEKIKELESEIERAEESLSKAKAELTKAKNNKANNSITAKQQYEEDILTYQNASAIYEIALSGVDDDVDDAAEELTTAKQNLLGFEASVGTGCILAEYTGTLTAVAVAAGDEITTDSSIATFVDADSVSLDVTVTEEDISAVSIGDKVSVELIAYPDETFSGSVSEISTAASSSSTVSYTVTVTLSGETDKLYAGMTGEVNFVTKQVDDVLYVSNKAITRSGTRSYVTVLSQSGAREQRQVETGFSDGTNVEIKSGLEEGDTVLIESGVSAK